MPPFLLNWKSEALHQANQHILEGQISSGVCQMSQPEMRPVGIEFRYFLYTMPIEGRIHLETSGPKM